MQSGLRLDELLREVQERLAEVVATRGRMQGLLDAVLAVASGLELEATLRRIVQAAVDLVDARYGALGRARPDRRHLAVHLRRAGRGRRGRGWGTSPRGRACSASSSSVSTRCGCADLSAHEASVGFPPHHPPMRTFLGVPVRVR